MVSNRIRALMKNIDNTIDNSIAGLVGTGGAIAVLAIPVTLAVAAWEFLSPIFYAIIALLIPLGLSPAACRTLGIVARERRGEIDFLIL